MLGVTAQMKWALICSPSTSVAAIPPKKSVLIMIPPVPSSTTIRPNVGEIILPVNSGLVIN